MNHEYYAVIPDKKWKGLSFKIHINSDPLKDSDPPIHLEYAFPCTEAPIARGVLVGGLAGWGEGSAAVFTYISRKPAVLKEDLRRREERGRNSGRGGLGDK